MSAIKLFFNEERARKNRILEMQKMIKQPIEPVYVVDQVKLDNAYKDILNWNMEYPEELTCYYYELDQEQYEYILEKRGEFPLDVQHLLWGTPILKFGESSNLKVKNLTDKMHQEKIEAEYQEFKNSVETELAKCEIPPRPSGQLDKSLADLHTRLKDEEEQLETIMKSPTKKYVAPSMRNLARLVDPDVQNMQTQISKTKNEISLHESYIVHANNGWNRLKQFELRNQVVQEMLAV